MRFEKEIKRNFTVTKLALTGKMRAGKDAAAHRLRLRHDFVGLAFGEDLKRIYHELNPWVPLEPKPRAAYQEFGQEMRRLYGEDIWIRHVERRLGILMESFEMFSDRLNVVITDLRQPNEYEWARAQGFTIVRVSAPDEVRFERALRAGDDFTADDLLHHTESYAEGFEVDFEIENSGSLDELQAQVDELITKISGKGAVY